MFFRWYLKTWTGSDQGLCLNHPWPCCLSKQVLSSCPHFSKGLTRLQSRCFIPLHAQQSAPATPFLLPPGLSTRLPSSAAPCWVWIYWKWSKLNVQRCFSRGWELCLTCSTLKASHGRLSAGGQSCQGKIT